MQDKVTAEEVVEYWLADSTESPEKALAQKQRWYRGGPTVDAEIVSRYTASVEAALRRELHGWAATSTGVMGLVILLDQFTRTIYRGSAAAFSGDPIAYDVVTSAIEQGLDKAMPVPGRIFFYHPFHHAETVAGQDRAIALVAAMKDEYPTEWHDYIQQSVDGFTRHRNIVARFGRFPHRNAVLGRETTAEEKEYLDGGADRFGQ